MQAINFGFVKELIITKYDGDFSFRSRERIRQTRVDDKSTIYRSSLPTIMSMPEESASLAFNLELVCV